MFFPTMSVMSMVYSLPMLSVFIVNRHLNLINECFSVITVQQKIYCFIENDIKN